MCDSFLRLLPSRTSTRYVWEISMLFVSFFRIECKYVNELCCLAYNNHYVQVWDENRRRNVVSFVTGDKIMATKNNDVAVYHGVEDEQEKSSGGKRNASKDEERLKRVKAKNERLMNGSVYSVKQVIFN